MSEAIAFLNGRFVPLAEAALPLADAGFVFGATVTDLCRTFNHKLYRWSEHLTRFRRSCSLSFLQVPLDDDALTAAAHSLIDNNAAALAPADDLALVTFATPGPIGYYSGAAGGGASAGGTFGMHTFPLPWSRYRRLVTSGAELLTPAVQQLPPACVDPRIKHRSRMHWWLAERTVQAEQPDAWALLLDAEGFVTETAAANFCLVRAGSVYSPPPGRILGGISLDVVRQLCTDLGIPFVEAPLRLEDCRRADEALLTGTAFCLAGVRRLNDITWPAPGPIVQRLHAAWSAAVGRDIWGQISSNAGQA